MSLLSVFSEDQKQEMFDELVGYAEELENSERAEKLVALYKSREEDLKNAPASGRLNFHNAMEGGYLDHVLRVVKFSKRVMKFYEMSGGMIDFKEDELLFCALNHDLGKIGTSGEPYYVFQDSDWHRTNKLETFKHNDNRQYMDSGDLTFFLLQEAGVEMTQNEFLGIKLAHGAYDKTTEPYYNGWASGPFPMRTNIHHIIHWADHMACCVEKDKMRRKLTDG